MAESQRPSAQLVGAPERQLEVPGSIPRWDEFRASLKKSPRCASSALGYLCLFATLRQGPLQSGQLTQPDSDGRPDFLAISELCAS
jgi:hypothetical protein